MKQWLKMVEEPIDIGCIGVIIIIILIVLMSKCGINI